MPPLHETGNEEGEEEEEEEEEVQGTCDFCGWGNGEATEDTLDLHYWQDCPFLMACTRCTQVIEISTLPEHLLTECSSKGEYAACQTCGMVSRGEGKPEFSFPPPSFFPFLHTQPTTSFCHPIQLLFYQAQLKTEIDEHTAAAKCKPVMDPKEGSWCPLCSLKVFPGKAGWVQHLLKDGCHGNPRTKKL